MLPQKNGSSLEKVLKNFFCIAKIKQNKGKHPKNPKKRLYRNKNSGGVCYTALRCKCYLLVEGKGNFEKYYF